MRRSVGGEAAGPRRRRQVYIVATSCALLVASCQRSNSGSSTAAPIVPAPLAASSAACAAYTVPTQLYDLREDGDLNLILVDTRSAERFRLLHIPGAINLPAHAIRTKPFLRGKDVVLVGEGTGAALEALVCNLRGQGFASVTILDGGLHGWMATGGTVVGTAAFRDVAGRLAAPGLQIELQRRRWLVLDLTDNGSFPNDLPAEIVRMPSADARTAAAELRRIAGHDRFVLVVDADGSRLSAVTSTLDTVPAENLYVLDGGTSGLRVWRQASQSSGKSLLGGCQSNRCGAQ